MAEPTLEEVIKRLATLEQKVEELTAEQTSKPARDTVGMMEDNEFTRDMLAAIEANSEAERRAALEEPE